MVGRGRTSGDFILKLVADMACRAVLLIIVTTGFAFAWDGDNRRQEESIALRSGRRTAPAHAMARAWLAPRERSPWPSGGMVPAALVPGTYRWIGHDGAIDDFLISSHDLARWGVERASASPARIELVDGNRRAYLIRLAAASEEKSPPRISLDDGGPRPTRR